MNENPLVSQDNKKQIFENVIFWINPNTPINEWDTIKASMKIRGAVEAKSLKSFPKIRGMALDVPPGLETEVYRCNFSGELHKSIFNQEKEYVQDQSKSKVDRITHIITKNVYFPEYLSALRNGVKVVTPLWAEQSIRFNKLQNEECYDPDASKIFTGMVVTASQLPLNDREALYGGILAYGGQYRQNLVKGVTHLVLLTGSGNKYEQIIANPQLKIKIVLPHWFEQCINLGILVDDKPYLFPDPQIFYMINKQPSPSIEASTQAENEAFSVTKPHSPTNFKNCADINAVEKHFKDAGMLEDTLCDSAFSNLSSTPFLCGYNVSLSISMFNKLDNRLILAIQGSLESAGGKFVYPPQHSSAGDSKDKSYYWSPSIFSKVDILVCQSRSGCDYFAASRLGKLVGSLIWLIKILKLEKIVLPTNHIFDYPLPEYPILDTSTSRNQKNSYVVGLSGYSGPAKLYLQRLITCMGASYVPQLSKNLHTHLVASNPSSIKFENAREWNCHVINHLWLENSFLEEKPLSVSHPNFTFWPPLSESALGKSVGCFNGIKPDVIEKSFFLLDPDYQKLLKLDKTREFSAENDSSEIASKQNGLISIANENNLVINEDSIKDLELNSSLKMFIFLAVSLDYEISLDRQLLLDLNKRFNSSKSLLGDGLLRPLTNINEIGLNETVNDTSDDESAGQDETPDRIVELNRNGLSLKVDTDKLNGNGRDISITNYNSLKVQMDAASLYELEILSGSNFTDGRSNSEMQKYGEARKKFLSPRHKQIAGNGRKNKHSDGEEGNIKPLKKSKQDMKQNRKNSNSINNTETQAPTKAKNPENPAITPGESSDCEVDTDVNINLVFTQGKPTDQEEKLIRKMGGHISTSIRNATHLISNGVKRTSKFLEAVTGGRIWIVSPKWLNDSLELRRWINLATENPSDEVIRLFEKRNKKNAVQNLPLNKWWWSLGYGVADAEVESKFNFKMMDSFYRAREHRLFEDFVIYITPNVQPSIETLQSLVKSGLGVTKHGLSARAIKSLIASTSQLSAIEKRDGIGIDIGKIVDVNETEESSSQEIRHKRKLIVISCEQDRHLWLPFLSISNSFNNSRKEEQKYLEAYQENESKYEPSNLTIPIYSSELLLTGVLRQSLALDTDEFQLI